MVTRIRLTSKLHGKRISPVEYMGVTFMINCSDLKCSTQTIRVSTSAAASVHVLTSINEKVQHMQCIVFICILSRQKVRIKVRSCLKTAPVTLFRFSLKTFTWGSRGFFDCNGRQLCRFKTKELARSRMLRLPCYGKMNTMKAIYFIFLIVFHRSGLLSPVINAVKQINNYPL